jgi:tetratricopeptide (TPR) repeat protein
MAMEMSGRFGDAIASALHALELDPDNARAMAFLAESYLDVNQPERALTTVNSALELDPSSFEAYRIRGRIIQESVFDFEAARADYQTAYDLAPNIPYPAIDLAWVEFRLDDLEGAIQTLEDVLDRTPENSQALYAMGSMYYQGVGDYNLASDFLTRCVQANPLSVSCHYLLGRSQMNLDQITAAATSLRTAIDLGSDDPKHFWWSGNAQIALGNCAEALSFLRPGYQLATEAQDPSLMEDYNFLLGQCGANVSPQVTPTPTA